MPDTVELFSPQFLQLPYFLIQFFVSLEGSRDQDSTIN